MYLNLNLGVYAIMEARTMRVQSRITPEVFREFALFDTFRRQKRHRRPLMFMAIMLAFAAACSRRWGWFCPACTFCTI